MANLWQPLVNVYLFLDIIIVIRNHFTDIMNPKLVLLVLPYDNVFMNGIRIIITLILIVFVNFSMFHITMDTHGYGPVFVAHKLAQWATAHEGKHTTYTVLHGRCQEREGWNGHTNDGLNLAISPLGSSTYFDGPNWFHICNTTR